MCGFEFTYELTPEGWDILKVAVPLGLGLAIWFIQTLAQRAWTEYEVRRDIYRDLITHVDALFGGSTRDHKVEFLRAVRQVWLVGSDDVIVAMNSLNNGIRNSLGSETHEFRYRQLVSVMRADLRKRRWLPPSGTKLGPQDFPLEGPGAPT